MPDYRRYRVPGWTYFFTVNLLERHSNDLLIRHIDLLRHVVRETKKRWPFHIDAWVVLPEHLHCVWTLPVGDDDNANRWRIIKQGFSKALPMTERRSAVRVARGERGIWQRRFWDRFIRDDKDYAPRIAPNVTCKVDSERSDNPACFLCVKPSRPSSSILSDDSIYVFATARKRTPSALHTFSTVS